MQHAQPMKFAASAVTAPEPRPLGELFSELAQETGTLVRKEVELARVEMTAKATTALKDIAFIVVGGAIAFAGGLALLAAVILGLGTLIPMWLSALIVGVLVAGLGGALAIGGVAALKRADLTPRQTIQTLKENQQWVREQAAR
jgi:hypothetical protein